MPAASATFRNSLSVSLRDWRGWHQRRDSLGTAWCSRSNRFRPVPSVSILMPGHIAAGPGRGLPGPPSPGGTEPKHDRYGAGRLRRRGSDRFTADRDDRVGLSGPSRPRTDASASLDVSPINRGCGLPQRTQLCQSRQRDLAWIPATRRPRPSSPTRKTPRPASLRAHSRRASKRSSQQEEPRRLIRSPRRHGRALQAHRQSRSTPHSAAARVSCRAGRPIRAGQSAPSR